MESLTIRQQQFDNELQNVGQETPYQPPKIQMVPAHLRNRENIQKHYLPRLISIGPIHHGSPNLKLGEKYKLMMAAKYIQSNKLNRADLHKKIADNIGDLKDHFDHDVLTGLSLDGFRDLDEKLSWMLFVDGCSLLWIVSLGVFDDFKADQIMLLMFLDVILLENQLPFNVLKLLWKDGNWRDDLLLTIDNFFKIHQLVTPVFQENKNESIDTMMKTSWWSMMKTSWWSNCFSVLRKKEKKHPLLLSESRQMLSRMKTGPKPPKPVSKFKTESEFESESFQKKNEKNHLQHIVSMSNDTESEIETEPESESELVQRKNENNLLQHIVSMPDRSKPLSEIEPESVSMPNETESVSEIETESESQSVSEIETEPESESEPFQRKNEKNHLQHIVSMPNETDSVSEIETELESEPVQRKNEKNHLQHIVSMSDESKPLSEIEFEPESEYVSMSNETEPVHRKNEKNHLQHIVSMSDVSKPLFEIELESVSMSNETEFVSKTEIEHESESVSMPNKTEFVIAIELPEFPVHLLHICRTIILGQSSFKAGSKIQDQESSEQNSFCCSKKSKKKSSQEGYASMFTYRNVQDLRAAGIKFESSKTRNPLKIKYSEGWFFGKLTLPGIVVNDMTAAVFHNLIAYEMCPDFKNYYEISSFASFMDRIIDYPEDVKELRSKGILINRLGSDEEVANLFNIICTDLVEGEIYDEVNKNIEKHYKNTFKTTLAQGIHGSFSSIWTTIGFLAAFMALALTFTQTWFAVHPAK